MALVRVPYFSAEDPDQSTQFLDSQIQKQKLHMVKYFMRVGPNTDPDERFFWISSVSHYWIPGVLHPENMPGSAVQSTVQAPRVLQDGGVLPHPL